MTVDKKTCRVAMAKAGPPELADGTTKVSFVKTFEV